MKEMMEIMCFSLFPERGRVMSLGANGCISALVAPEHCQGM